MVTIIPIDIEHDLIQRGVQMAVAEEIQSSVKQLNELARDLLSGGCVEREELDEAFARIAAAREKLVPVLDYARAFADQWPPESPNHD